MIVSGFFYWLYELLVGVFSDFNFSIDIPYDSIAVFFDYVRIGLYFLPVGTLRTIFGVIFILTAFKIFISFFKTLWGILPVA